MEWRVNTFFSDPLEAPFAEEFTFRGAILTSLNTTRLGRRSFLGLRHGTLAFSAVHLLVLFNGMPLIEVPPFIASALVAGIVFGYFYQRTQNLWYGIFFHALGNVSRLLP
jgi:membrane protease YdiL (CAAX protease family)